MMQTVSGAEQRVRSFLEHEHPPHHYAWCATALIFDEGAHVEAIGLVEAMVSRVPAEHQAEAGRVAGCLRRASDKRDPEMAREAFWRGLAPTYVYRGGGLYSASNLGDACNGLVNALIHVLTPRHRAA